MKPSNQQIDNRIDSWDEGECGDIDLHEALGWTREEYAAWLTDGNAVPDRPLPEPVEVPKIRIPPIPSKASADQTHPWFWPFSHQIVVRLDGNLVNHAIHVDTEAGKMWVYKFTDAGFSIEEVSGVVTLEPHACAVVDETMVTE